jgi:WhiB family redox-sensing transcriptional regulator
MAGYRGNAPVLAAPQHEEEVIRFMDLSWRHRSACRGVDPDVFYPVSDEAAEAAKAVCATCPVRQPCLEYALVKRERDGVWGGATERERRRMIRQRRKTA